MDTRNGRQSSSLPRIRVLSLGNCGVGKSCLIKRYCEQRFVQRYLPTIGIDYGSTTVEVDGRRVSVHFFDTSGSPLFEEVRTEFYPDMQGVMLVYDVTDRASFVALDHWMAELRHNLGPAVSNLVLLVVGTRSDTGGSATGRQVSESDGRAWATQQGAKHVVTSAALGTGVTHAFMSLFSAALQSKENFTASSGPTPTTSTGSSSKPTSTSTSNSKNTNTFPKHSSNTTSSNSTNGSAFGAAGSKGSNKPPAGQKTAAGASSSKAGSQTGGSSSSSEADVMAAIHRLLHSSDHFHKMQLSPRSLTKEEVNKAYRRLAGLVHPDKCKAPGAEEAFKKLAQARTAVLAMITETTV